jgi:hypothetical protein
MLLENIHVTYKFQIFFFVLHTSPCLLLNSLLQLYGSLQELH